MTHNQKKTRQGVFFLLVFLCFFLENKVWAGPAGCKINLGTYTPKVIDTSGVILSNLNGPVGTKLGEVNTYLYFNLANRAIISGACRTKPWVELTPKLFPTLSSYGNYVYETNIPGLGIEIQAWLSGVINNAPTVSHAFTIPEKYSIEKNIFDSLSNASNRAVLRLGMAVSFHKTSSEILNVDLSKVHLLSGGLTNIFIDEMGLPPFLLSGTPKVVTPACKVSNSVINVAMGDASRRTFTGLGSSSNKIPFNISVNCSVSTNIKIMLEAKADPSGAQGVIALNNPSASDSASGVGVQLLYKDMPVTLSTPMNLGSVNSGLQNIPFTARYYQTSTPVRSGKANSTATFTLTYN